MKNLKFLLAVLLFASGILSTVSSSVSAAESDTEDFQQIEELISAEEPILQKSSGDDYYYTSLMIRYGVLGNDKVYDWHKGSFGHQIESLQYHYMKHKSEVGATSMAQYMNKADGFRQNLRGAKKVKTNGSTPNVYKYTKNGKYIMIQSGTNLIVSFGSV